MESAGFHDGNYSKIVLNGFVVCQEGKRGLNVVALNHLDGTIIDSTHFDTHASTQESDDFAFFINSLEHGTHVVIAAKDEFQERITELAKEACESLGSTMIRNVRYRDSWCLIGQKGDHKEGSVAESHRPRDSGPCGPLELNLFLVIGENHDAKCGAGDTTDHSLNSTFAASNHYLASYMSSHGRWIRRRKIDGALQRTRCDFYPRVHRMLERSFTAIKVNKAILPRDPTVSEKTPEEINFYLQVEEVLNAFLDPAERAIAVECLLVVSEIQRRNADLHFGDGVYVLDLVKVLRETYSLFWDSWMLSNGAGYFDGIDAISRKGIRINESLQVPLGRIETVVC